MFILLPYFCVPHSTETVYSEPSNTLTGSSFPVFRIFKAFFHIRTTENSKFQFLVSSCWHYRLQAEQFGHCAADQGDKIFIFFL